MCPTCLSARGVNSLPGPFSEDAGKEEVEASIQVETHEDHPRPPAVLRHLLEDVMVQKGSDLVFHILNVGIKWECVCRVWG